MKFFQTFLLLVYLGLIFFPIQTEGQNVLYSPDNSLELKIDTKGDLCFSTSIRGKQMVKEAKIDLLFNDTSCFNGKKVRFEKFSSEDVFTVFPSYKNANVTYQYTGGIIDCGPKNHVEFRLYNHAIAYRFVTKVKDTVTVNEKFDVTFADNFASWASLYKKYEGAYQEEYTKVDLNQFPDSMMTYLPYLLGDTLGNKILITESDHFDYPHMFMKKGTNENQIVATFPPYPLEVELYSDRRSRITKEANYIAKTTGNRTFPWRVLLTTENDGQLIESDLIYALSRKTNETNNNWIKPGRVAWDWWNASNLYGVDFESGLNTNTWKYYIDFAAENGLEYVILDEGWSVSTTDLTKANPDTDLQFLIDYGKQKEVGVILWSTWRALSANWEILDKFVEWGVAGIKVDFMDRADQKMVNFYEKAAAETFKRKLLIDFHGAYKPTGLRRLFPNVISYEGVGGLEESKWSKQNTPQFSLQLPFIRMVCGPMDYTPGAMRNFHSDKFQYNFTRPSSQGTRSHQVALFAIYESGVQMFADSPSNYIKEQESTDFLTQIPNTWDETKVLKAKIGEYLVLARRKGEMWIIAGVTNQISRDFEVDLSFMKNLNYKVELMKDGINSDKFAEDYKINKQEIETTKPYTIHMNKEGGFVAILR